MELYLVFLSMLYWWSQLHFHVHSFSNPHGILLKPLMSFHQWAAQHWMQAHIWLSSMGYLSETVKATTTKLLCVCLAINLLF